MEVLFDSLCELVWGDGGPSPIAPYGVVARYLRIEGTRLRWLDLYSGVRFFADEWTRLPDADGDVRFETEWGTLRVREIDEEGARARFALHKEWDGLINRVDDPWDHCFRNMLVDEENARIAW
jgi:hypothetical protein